MKGDLHKIKRKRLEQEERERERERAKCTSLCKNIVLGRDCKEPFIY